MPRPTRTMWPCATDARSTRAARIAIARRTSAHLLQIRIMEHEQLRPGAVELHSHPLADPGALDGEDLAAPEDAVLDALPGAEVRAVARRGAVGGHEGARLRREGRARRDLRRVGRARGGG